MAQDTRKDPRAKVLSMTVRYKSATVDEFIEHHAQDVSRGGIFIKTPSPFPPGTLLKFEIRLQDEQAVIAGVGRVVWKREAAQANESLPSGMGVKFIKIDDKSKALISRIVEQNQNAGAAFEAGGGEQRNTPTGDGEAEADKSSADQATAARKSDAPPAKAGAKRASTMLGLGSIGASGKVEAVTMSTSESTSDEGGSFFPKTEPEKEMPPTEERTMMKQAKELLAQALAEAGASLEDLGSKEEPLIAPEPKKEEPAEAKAETKIEAAPKEEPAAAPKDTPKEEAPEAAPAKVAEADKKEPVSEPKPKAAKSADKEAARTDKPSEKKPSRDEVKTVDERPKRTGAAKQRTEERAAAAKPALAAAHEEESGGSGKIIAFVVIAAAIVGAILYFTQKDEAPPAPPAPATTQPAEATPPPAPKPEPTPAPTENVVPASSAAVEPTAAPSATAPAVSASAEPAAAPSAAPTASAVKAQPSAEPKPTPTVQAPAPKPPTPKPPAPAPKPKDDDVY
ncbi:uncharacterized protein CMC5_059090 [Chondromyces crocatus]|uniref:PilZ domain-containing protein n=2 Tax=Chondromyces crocatus TaxID=52 RepID=A0A0K1ELE1_CHOCO|nr:uncharacterized protein CMC5_059090 [Chondromyces crocatus]